MNFSKQNITNYLLYGTEADNLFISEYMAAAKGEHVKQYFMALMYAQLRQPLDNDQLAKKLGTDLPSVLAGWDYWEEQGVIRKIYPDPESRNSYEVEFVNLREEAFGRSEKKAQPQKAVILGDREYSKLLRDIEAETGRLLDSREPEEISAWISHYGMDPQMILFGYSFCSRNRKSNKYRYVGAVLKDWLAKGFTTRAQVEEYLENTDKHYDLYRKVFRELGFHRMPSEPEKQIMDGWFDRLGFSLDEVLAACKKTSGISNPNINYVNSILMSRFRDAQSSARKASGERVYSTIDALYERDREENERKSAEIRREIITKIPQIGSILTEIREAGFRASKLMLAGGDPSAAEALRAKVRDLYAERAQLLSEGGFAADALDPIYTCKDCRDTGFLEDGSRCHCYREKAEQLIAENR